MTWKLIKFGDIELPQYQLRRADAGKPDTAVIRSYQLDTIGGSFDKLGTRRGRGQARTLQHGGWYTGDDAQDVQRQVDELGRLMWTRQKLWRQNRDGSQHWLWARLTSFQPTDIGFKTYQRLQMTFETLEDSWRGAEHTVERIGNGSLLLPNAGNADVWSVTLTVTGNTVQGFEVDYDAGDRVTEWQYNLALTAGGWEATVVVDSELHTVVDGSDNSKWDYFTIGSNHTHEDWFYLPAGGGRVSVSGNTGSGSPTFSFNYYERWV
jgi:hypothetical protein